MFLALVICHLALVAASPFHKYPYVFLLDIGNEELEKTNTEQIKLSAPGGSIAIRYPAVGTGETIAYIRVSGIDFGTDLKANIVEGGPGYKYVVLVFMGNQGSPYDAVITIQTVSDEYIDENQSESVSNDKISENSDSAETSNEKLKEISNAVDENVSSEDISDELDSLNTVNENKQVAQQSSNVYAYANSAADYNEDNDDENGTSNEEVVDRQPSDADFVAESKTVDNENNQDAGSDEVEPSHYNDNDGDDVDNENESINNVNTKAYEQYQPALPLRAYDGVRIYPQYSVPFALSTNYNSVYSPDALDSDQASDDYDRGESDKYNDSNNNYFESDDASAVES